MNKESFNILFLITLDTVAFYTSFTLAYFTRKLLNAFPLDIVQFNISYSALLKLWWIPLIFILFIAYEQLYVKRYPFWDETRELLKALTISVVVVFAVVSLGKKSESISRLTVLMLWGYSIFMFPLFRYFGKKLLYKLGVWRRNLLILGAGRAGVGTAKGLQGDEHLGYEIVGFLDDYKKGSIEVGDRSIPVLGKISKFKDIIRDKNVATVVIAIPSMDKERLSALANNVHKYVKRIFIVPDLKGIALLNSELYHLFVQQLFLIKVVNNFDSRLNQILKRSFDLLLSLFMLPFLLPIMGFIALLIKLDSPGSILFVQERLGRNGKVFRCYKFRTMYENSDELLKGFLENNPELKTEWNRYKKLKGYDPRVTKIGKFLRKTSLDELPQIFNVLKGEMSLVGPRPYLPREREDMEGYIDTILMTRPGITGLWQISGRNKLTFKDRLKLDTWYVLNWSLWLDVVILFKTIKVVFKREGAY
ncbi:undecaprenyl-phosphate galactose phosphotransferase WbaP [Hydrogenivirga sp. 128-5-R1-1]|uniref:undecaprenyl-phosphate galactose phosphotransferase WbaP n=1 Tax=Hydrogenivirga sp. 128-5-R1-1 TaxID=392423 RepID=UPI00015EF7E4|nr:undecaprenyl-phosphate galactose phosphotransferase WbaP [Hydrogenivirga sp. 128-5-R1-1]EDP75586.1 undecaprenyl-phosphate galactosephosphotransferase [Hydrogenivirga sp. 128-5-R1-1]